MPPDTALITLIRALRGGSHLHSIFELPGNTWQIVPVQVSQRITRMTLPLRGRYAVAPPAMIIPAA